MTNKQKEMVYIFNQTKYSMVYSFLSMAKDCNEAIVDLPATNEAGEPVTVGDNRQMTNIRDTFIEIAQVAKRNLTRAEELRLAREFQFDWGRGEFKA